MREYKRNLKMMKECRRYIDEHLNEKLKPEDLAKQFGYSYASFRRIFWEIGGYTVYEYIRLRRVQTAARCIRHGGDLAEATKKGCFRTYAGFYKAFLDVYGMNPSEYLRTRGTDLMTEPEIVSREAFYIVGYCLPGEKGLSLEDRAAYWIAQEFPSVSEREYARIGGGPEMISVWIENKKTAAYITGPGVKQVQYIPKPMKSVYIPGGLFAAFHMAESENNTMLWENARVTWYYAYEQWMPDSDYLIDGTRLPYEYYLDGDNLVYVPIKPKIKPEKKKPRQNQQTTE